MIEHAAWRWAFFINVSLAAVTLAITFWQVPESRSDNKAGRPDDPGAQRGLSRLLRASTSVDRTEMKNDPGNPPSEEAIDQTLTDSYPASDPPSWTLGIEGRRGPELKEREMENYEKLFASVDLRLSNWMAHNGIRLLRISLGIVFFWFGALKLFPGLSPAQDRSLCSMPVPRLWGQLGIEPGFRVRHVVICQDAVVGSDQIRMGIKPGV